MLVSTFSLTEKKKKKSKKKKISQCDIQTGLFTIPAKYRVLSKTIVRLRDRFFMAPWDGFCFQRKPYQRIFTDQFPVSHRNNSSFSIYFRNFSYISYSYKRLILLQKEINAATVNPLI